MDDFMLVQMFDCRQHFLHKDRSPTFTKSLTLDDGVEQLSAFSQFHNDMNILVIDVALVELYDVWMINLLENGELFFQETHILFNILSQNALDCVFDVWLLDSMCQPDCAEVTAAYEFLKFVDLPHVVVGIVVLDVLEFLFAWTCASYGSCFDW
jgi:hypothetical protein